MVNAGYTLVYNQPYRQITNFSDLVEVAQKCDDSTILCAGGIDSNTNVYKLISCGNCLQALGLTSNNFVKYVNNAYWYLDPNKSFGFSPVASINLASADIQDCELVTEENWSCTDDLKLSWLLDGLPGWRLGKRSQLEDETYYKNILLL